jgi:hypothetical protein
MPLPSYSSAPLSPHAAFVVQMREGTPLTPAEVQGRIEHVTSGQATYFASLRELWEFIAQVLQQSRRATPEG